MKNWLFLGPLLFSLLSCGLDDEAQLPSVEDRTDEAIRNLVDQLTAPPDGWRLNYQPTSGSGTFLILMDFNSDGTLRLRSDIPDNDGEFEDHTVTYRVDSRQGLELILETYGVFHYLFELRQAQFGGEFEFDFLSEDSGNLEFSSKTDGALGEFTTITLTPASGSDSDLLSASTARNLASGTFQTDNLAGLGVYTSYNLYIPSDNTTISFSLDITSRQIKIEGASVGQTLPELQSATTSLSIASTTTYSLLNDAIVLQEPQNFDFNGRSYSISSIPIGTPQRTIETFCEGAADSITVFSNTSANGIGNFTLNSSLFQAETSFVPGVVDFGTIDPIFIYDENDESLGTFIQENLPNVVAFQWYNGFELGDGTNLNAIGFLIPDAFNSSQFYLRGISSTRTGNFYTINFTGDDLVTEDDPSQELLDAVEEVSNVLLEGGTLYVVEVISANNLYQFYNPCNGYKGFLQNF